MTQPLRIAIEPTLPFSRRPFRARVVTVPAGLRLGLVRWAPRKREYVFEPSRNTTVDDRLMSAIGSCINSLPQDGSRA